MSCLAGKIFHSHNKILLSRDENNLLIDHSKFLKIFCDLYMYYSGSCYALFVALKKTVFCILSPARL